MNFFFFLIGHFYWKHKEFISNMKHNHCPCWHSDLLLSSESGASATPLLLRHCLGGSLHCYCCWCCCCLDCLNVVNQACFLPEGEAQQGGSQKSAEALDERHTCVQKGVFNEIKLKTAFPNEAWLLSSSHLWQPWYVGNTCSVSVAPFQGPTPALKKKAEFDLVVFSHNLFFYHPFLKPYLFVVNSSTSYIHHIKFQFQVFIHRNIWSKKDQNWVARVYRDLCAISV